MYIQAEKKKEDDEEQSGSFGLSRSPSRRSITTNKIILGECVSCAIACVF